MKNCNVNCRLNADHGALRPRRESMRTRGRHFVYVYVMTPPLSSYGDSDDDDGGGGGSQQRNSAGGSADVVFRPMGRWGRCSVYRHRLRTSHTTLMPTTSTWCLVFIWQNSSESATCMNKKQHIIWTTRNYHFDSSFIIKK